MNSKEKDRLQSLYEYETLCYEKGINVLAGMDEAGRGPLAGPVVAAAVILPQLVSEDDFSEFCGINDSKKLSPKKREKLFSLLLEHPNVYMGVGLVSETEIDKTNILQATQHAMRKAVSNLDVLPDYLLVDGMIVPGIKISQQKIFGGDRLSLSVAAASIVAKVTRDNIMCEYHKKYPEYSFDKHKGYGTKEHMQKIRIYGACKIHRKTFQPIALMEEIGYE